MDFLATPEFWVAAAFIGFVALVIYMKAPAMVAKALDERADAIRSELEGAQRLREEAQAMLADYQRRQRDAVKECDAIIAQARADAESLIAESRIRLDETLARREQLAIDRIAQAEAQAQASIRAEAAQLVVAASREILAKQLEGAPGAGLVDAAIADLPKHLH